MGLVESFVNWWYKRAWGEAASGLELDCANALSVRCDGKVDAANVYRQLSLLLPEGSNVCLEVIAPAQEVLNVIANRVTSDMSIVKPSTLWPKPSLFHLPAIPDVLYELAQLADEHASEEMGHHVYAYRSNRMLLSWCDFPDPDCLLISAELPYQAVHDFCDSIGCVLCEQAES